MSGHGKSDWWRDTAIKLPENNAPENLTCRIGLHHVCVRDGVIRAADALEKLPVAVLVS
jgi:maltooligosyltrehalose synthase